MGDPNIRQQIFQRIAALKPDSRPLWGKMSAHQMVCHLSDSFRVPIGKKHASPATGLFHQTVLKWLALYAPITWPKGVATRPEVEQGAGGTPPAHFCCDRSGLIELIEQFSTPHRSFEWAPHPIFGAMRDRDWLRWGYLHADHHLRQFGV